ncbi:hypothetical protein [Mangrovimonas cancribranchiae]|uniref:GOLD domain-containing protein n=1 Tax=Mangrovimonas cancribranchiae TaxID=3080055 RepID=A0AAU6NW43_9FLAO
MKKTLAILLILLTFSCSVEDDSPETYHEILPVESAIVPDEFELNEVYDIQLTYIRPTNCHAFYDIYYAKSENERTVAIISTVFPNDACETIDAELEISFNFKPTETGSYIFKFWQGEDDNGEDEYMIVEVPVVE